MPGYYRSPTIYGDSLVFASEDDLWTVSPEGGIARRLTSAVGATRAPCFSPDGSLLAMVSSDEGPAEVHVMDAQGGELSRLTYQAANAIVAGWTPDGSGIYYASNGEQPYAHVYHLWTQPVAGGIPQRLPYGPADCISHGPGSRLVLARHGRRDPARYVVESFTSGMHFGGLVAYYIPDLVLGESTSFITNLDRCIACAWIVVPFGLLVRSTHLARLGFKQD